MGRTNFIFINYRIGGFKKYESKGMIEKKFSNETHYSYDNSTWVEIDMYKYYEGCMMLARIPLPSFDELIQIFENSSIEDELIGAVSLILNKHLQKFIIKMDGYINSNSLDKKIIKRIKYLRKNVFEETEVQIAPLKENREDMFLTLSKKLI